MKHYMTPTIQTLTSSTDRLLLVQAQGTGADIPSNPDFNCANVDCGFFKNTDLAFFSLSWEDNAGENLSGYTVVINIQDTNNVYTDATDGCEITESPAGFYTLQCEFAEISGSGCACPQTDFNLVSITDGEGHSINVNTENCTINPSDCDA